MSWRRRDAINDARLERKIHERGLEKKALLTMNDKITYLAKKRRQEHASLTKRLKTTTISLPAIPPRRTTT
jgi:hypothetical protein